MISSGQLIVSLKANYLLLRLSKVLLLFGINVLIF